MQFGVPVPSRRLELERDATHPHRLTAVGGSHAQRLFIDRAPAARARASGTPEEFALELAVLTDYECGPPSGHATHAAPGAKIAILDPELISLDVMEHLSE